MARDPGLEQMLNDALTGESGITNKPMFGGLAWMLHGNMLCAARVGSVLFRPGAGRDAWALSQPGVARMTFSNGRQMPGWVRASTAACGDPVLFARLLDESLEFVKSLPAKL